MNRIPALLKTILLIACLAGTAVSTQAQDGSHNGITLTAQAGYDSYYKMEYGIPVHINVANTGSAVEGELRITLGSAAIGDRIVYTSPISLPTQSNKRVTLYINTLGFTNTLAVELVDDKGQLISSASAGTLSQLTANDLLYGVVSPDPGELEFLENVSGSRGQAAVAFLDLADLPVVPPAWNALDVLVLNDVDTGQLTSEQIDTMSAWVNTGGQLLLTGGPGWQKTTAALIDLLPVTITGSESVDDLPALSIFTGEPFRDPGPYLVTTSSLNKGELLYHQDGLPILAVAPLGQGNVFFLALDPKLAPLLDWDGSERLWSDVANRVPALPIWARGIQDTYAAETAVSSLPSLALPSTAILALFLFIYVIIIGPVNYLFLKRMNRRELAWATIPAIILVFSGLAYITGFQIKGNDVIINQMAVAYGQADSDQMRVQSLLGLYSPRRSRFDLTVPGSTLTRPFQGGYGGGIQGSGRVEAIRRSSDLTLEGVRVDVSDTETFIADHYQPTIDLTGRASLIQDGGDIQLQATILNNSSIILDNATLLLGSTVIQIGDIDPGQETNIREKIASGSASSSPSFGPVFGPTGYGSPLLSHADLILGTANYYDDRNAFPRWQLLQAIANNPSGLSVPNQVRSADTITFIAWSKEPQLAVSLGEVDFNSIGTTLYFLELPLSQSLISGSNVTVPISLLNWQALDENGIYDPSIFDLYLSGNWVEFEYQPWPEFQSMAVTELGVNLQTYDTVQPVPQVRLWDWAQESWITLNKVAWGQLIIPNHGRFLGPGNAVRIRLQDTAQYGISISEVYPVLTGNLP